jgi:D-alanyl-D-alanine carboxypeptidase
MRRTISLLVAIVLVAALVVGIWTIASHITSKKGVESEPPATETVVTEKEPEEKEKPPVEEKPLLVNAQNPLPDNYTLPPIQELFLVLPVRDDTIRVSEEIVEPLTALFQAASESGYDQIFVTSAFRTGEEQAMLYEEAPDKSFVMPSGSSEHETGLAVDIAIQDNYLDATGYSGAWVWLAENSWRYGFILRYPSDKVEITGISYEPWHFRYVGEKAARICYKKNLCLEEYCEAY